MNEAETDSVTNSLCMCHLDGIGTTICDCPERCPICQSKPDSVTDSVTEVTKLSNLLTQLEYTRARLAIAEGVIEGANLWNSYFPLVVDQLRDIPESE